MKCLIIVLEIPQNGKTVTKEYYWYILGTINKTLIFFGTKVKSYIKVKGAKEFIKFKSVCKMEYSLWNITKSQFPAIQLVSYVKLIILYTGI